MTISDLKEKDEDKKYYKVSTEIVKHIQVLFFDVYIRRGTKYVKVFKKTQGVDPERISNYEGKGVGELFILDDDRNSYFLRAGQIVSEVLEKEDANIDEKVEVIHEITNLVMMEIYQDLRLDSSIVETTLLAAKDIVTHLSRDNKSMIAFLRSSASDFYLCKHSIAVCILSIILAKFVGNESPKTISNVGLGALLHDIGMSQISKDITAKSTDEMSADELKEYKLHPQYGMNMVQQSKDIPTEVRQIIYHHHEQPNGQGFPNYLRSSDIAYMAKLVSICDVFSNLTTKFENKEACKPLEAIALMQEQIGVFDHNVLKSFIDLIFPKY